MVFMPSVGNRREAVDARELGLGLGLHAACVAGAFSVWTEFTVPTGKRQWTPERHAIGRTHGKSFKRRSKGVGTNGILER